MMHASLFLSESLVKRQSDLRRPGDLFRFPGFRPMALRPCLSAGLPLSSHDVYILHHKNKMSSSIRGLLIFSLPTCGGFFQLFNQIH